MPQKFKDMRISAVSRTPAFWGPNGSMACLGWPPFVSPPCFANLLVSPQNGRGLIAPVDPAAKKTWSYRGHTLILETRIETADGIAIVTDFMPVKADCSHVIRLVRGISGSIKLRTELIIRFDYGAVVPWV